MYHLRKSMINSLAGKVGSVVWQHIDIDFESSYFGYIKSTPQNHYISYLFISALEALLMYNFSL